MKNQVFKSKTDLWILIVLWGSVGICLFAILSLSSGEEVNQPLRVEVTPVLAVILFILLAASIALVLSILFYTRYIIRDKELIVRCGPFAQYIDISRIHTVKLNARTFLSSPRLSMDSMCIKYNRYDDVFISPPNKENFLQILKAINPSIKVK